MRRTAATRALDGNARHRILRDILDRRRLRSVYQPIVELSDHRIVGFEALARGPVGSPLEMPDQLFTTARQGGRLQAVEWAARAAAIQGALDANLGGQFSLFINVEPSVVGRTVPPEVDKLLRVAQHKLRIVLELTERDLTRRPADLLQLVNWARERWWGVALDDVGADPASLTLLPFIRPDVVKLDMRLVQEELTDEDERVLEAVREHCRRTGASILAEGIETEEHIEVAKGLGANLGQGWYFGRPGPLEAPRPTGAAARLLPPPEDDGESPFDHVKAIAGSRRIPRDELLAITAGLEARALDDHDRPVVMAGFGLATRFVGRKQTYLDLLGVCSLVGVVGVGMDRFAGSDLRIGPVDDRSPLSREWIVAIVGAETGSVVVAKGLGNDAVTVEPSVEVATSDDRDVAVDVARILLEQVLSTDEAARAAVANRVG